MRALGRTLLGLLCGLGCFNPKLGDAPFSCGDASSACPPGYECDTQTATCVVTLDWEADGAIEIDAGAPDSGKPDAALVLLPSNLPATTCTDPAENDQELDENLEINTDDLCPELLTQEGVAPDICVFRYKKVILGTDGYLHFIGSRAVALVATESMTIDGVIDVSGKYDVGGPGAQQTSASTATLHGDGGGGGGFGDIGAAGGTGASGGAVHGDPDLSPLFAGENGAHGGTGDAIALGGGGGGALQLVSCAGLSFGNMARVHAGGGGGEGGHHTSSYGGGGGGGGGSGGAILIEAVHIVFGTEPRFTANGGGGGGGATLATDGAPGQAASPSAEAAAGGDGAGSVAAGDGGNGGAVDAPATPGEPPAVELVGAGGGGGAFGRIRVNVPSGVEIDFPEKALFSPRRSVGIVPSQ